ncbi:MAG: hypothetical protein JWL83_2913, partial [Actinomycetia bacterium]|nr:hypothetical protein [Actinomycetes bacterium]
MDDLERAGTAFADRPELEPTPVGVIRELAHRRRRRTRIAATVAIAAAATVTTIVAGAITTTHRTSAGSVFAGGPSTARQTASSSTTTPPSSPANSPTTTQAPTPIKPLFTPAHTAYVAGGFDVTEFSFMQTQYGIPTAMTLTPGAVWYSTGGRLVRFDASRKSVTRVTRVGLDIGQLTSTPGTV